MNTATQNESRARAEQSDQTQFTSPEVNIFETKEGYVLEAEMPDVSKEGLEITLEGTDLTITGHRNRQPQPGQPLFRESRGTDFRRAFELDPAIDAAKISARMDQGVLTLTLPKLEKTKPRKIAVS
jgi:HSP20 family protein